MTATTRTTAGCAGPCCSGAGRVWQRELNLIYQPRPSVARFGASTVGFLGGALHVDRPQRHNWLSGFPNYILRRHREHAAALFNRSGRNSS